VELDRVAAEEWLRAHVEPTGPIELASDEPWATVLRIPLRAGSAWFKACAPVQAFEPRLSAALCARWPDRVAEVLAWEAEPAWLLLADAGTPIGVYGNPPEAWLQVLPAYAELQRGETAHASDHVAHGVPDLRLAALPARYEELLRAPLPLDGEELERLRATVPQVEQLCEELADAGIPETVQHDDLHMANVYADGDRLRVLDWGDASISHPFASLVVTFHFLEEVTKLPRGDPWFARLRDAYLEPWGRALGETFELAQVVGTVAHAVAWGRQRAALPADRRVRFDEAFARLLRAALARADERQVIR